MKTLSKMALAVFIVALLSATASSAATAHEFLASKTGNLTGSADTSLTFEIAAGGGEYILCDKAHILGAIHNLNTGDLIIIVDCEEATANTFLGELSATLSGLEFEINANGTASLLKPAEVSIGGGLATQTIPAQSGLSSVSYSNSSGTIMLSWSLTGIHSEGSLGNSTSGTLSGEMLLGLEGGTVEWK